jgi:hypothetical protein
VTLSVSSSMARVYNLQRHEPHQQAPVLCPHVQKV